jgi:hypothetical protein
MFLLGFVIGVVVGAVAAFVAGSSVPEEDEPENFAIGFPPEDENDEED